MKDPDFEAKVSSIMKRLSRLRAAQRGEADAVRVLVRAHNVSAHRRRSHYRVVIVARKQRTVTRRKAA